LFNHNDLGALFNVISIKNIEKNIRLLLLLLLLLLLSFVYCLEQALAEDLTIYFGAANVLNCIAKRTTLTSIELIPQDCINVCSLPNVLLDFLGVKCLRFTM
jgi:hypothetical protein